MKKYWKTAGLIALAAGVLYYPALKLYQYVASKKNSSDTNEKEETPEKHILSAYRGKHKPHHRHAHMNGQTDHQHV